MATREGVRNVLSNIPSDETLNAESSLKEIVLLLSSNAWIYDFKLTRFFLDRVWERLPPEWNDVIQTLTIEDLSGLPYGETRSSWPATLNQFIKDCLSLFLPRDTTPRQHPVSLACSQLSQNLHLYDQETDISCRDSGTGHSSDFTSIPYPISPSEIDDVIRKGMSDKKLHEVCHMTSLIDHVMKRSKCNVVVDVGSGLGYLGQVLHTKFGHPVLGLEGKQCHTSGAEKRAVKNSTCSFLHNVTCELQPTEESNQELLSLISDWFSSLSQEVSTCCHRTGSTPITSNRLHKDHTNDNQSVEDHQSGSTENAFAKSQSSQTFETHSKNCDRSEQGATGMYGNCWVSEIVEETVSETDKSILNENSTENDVVKNLEGASVETKCPNSKTETMETLGSDLNLLRNKKIDFEDTGPRVCMVGLHCCGDLTPTMLKCFQELDCIRSLCCVSCCYHRMKFDENSRQFENFPVSSLVKRIIERIAPGWNPGPFGMRLAAQETRARWCAQTSRDHETHTRHVAYRGILELCLDRGKFHLRKTSRKLVHERDFRDFAAYVDAISKHIDVSGTEKDVCAEQFKDEMTALYHDYQQDFSYIEPITALQVLLQPVLESLIYLDRRWWLTEQGLISDIIPVFDEFISPRNLALVAMK